MANRFLSFVWIVVLAVGVDGVPTTTSSTTTSSTACPTVMQDRNPRLPQFHCNKPGYTTDQSFLINFVTYNGYKPCYDACLADSRCISFAYGDGSVEDEVSFQSTCMTFATTIDAKNFTAQAGSPTSYWNLKGCFNIPSGCSTSGVVFTRCPQVAVSWSLPVLDLYDDNRILRYSSYNHLSVGNLCHVDSRNTYKLCQKPLFRGPGQRDSRSCQLDSCWAAAFR